MVVRGQKCARGASGRRANRSARSAAEQSDSARADGSAYNAVLNPFVSHLILDHSRSGGEANRFSTLL
jgi:hypothetical protein